MATAESILQEALHLPEDERATVAAKLLDSLNAPDLQEDISNDEWVAEIERRAQRALNGEPGIPWEQVEANVRQHLSSLRK
jgi:putative addiction module component (TIGR02574 family)